MTDLPWSMSATLVATREPDPLDVLFWTNTGTEKRFVFRKCCSCMSVAGAGDVVGVRRGSPIEFVCGCGNHPSVMVCDGKVIGTSA